VQAENAECPLAGTLELSPNRPLRELLTDQSALVAPAIAEGEKLRVGDTLHIGGKPFCVAGVLEREAEPLTFSFMFGPRVLMTQAALNSTVLLGLGHRARAHHRAPHGRAERGSCAALARPRCSRRSA
jgi:putative ABC transport system permease protein